MHHLADLSCLRQFSAPGRGATDAQKLGCNRFARLLVKALELVSLHQGGLRAVGWKDTHNKSIFNASLHQGGLCAVGCNDTQQKYIFSVSLHLGGLRAVGCKDTHNKSIFNVCLHQGGLCAVSFLVRVALLPCCPTSTFTYNHSMCLKNRF